MTNKEILLNEIVTSRGFEDELTIALFRIAEHGGSYNEMSEYAEEYMSAEMDENWA